MVVVSSLVDAGDAAGVVSTSGDSVIGSTGDGPAVGASGTRGTP